MNNLLGFMRNRSPDENALATSFGTEVRPLIDLIDRLRGFGLDKDINLPAVAVIGDQSAGKSSVLEAISGVQLPRGTGIVTRCPLEMRMKHRKDGQQWRGKISYTAIDGQEQTHTIQGREDVGTFVTKAQVEMTGDKIGISNDLITLEVMSPDVPDLTLIDLPGIARNAADGQPKDIEEKIKNLIRMYIERQATIILAVLQCNIDIATCEAIKMAKEFDEDGCRTLGVLTKPDLVDPGAEEGVMRILENEVFPLSKGYVIVKCRGQKAVESHQSLKVALTEENTFFKNHENFKMLPPSQRGIGNLSVRLTRELKTHIQILLPQLRDEVQKLLLHTEEKLKSFGKCPRDRNEKRQIVHEKVNHFATVVARITCGESVDDQLFPTQVNRLYNDARKSFTQFFKKVHQNSPSGDERRGFSKGSGYKTLRQNLKQELEDGRGRELCDYAGKFEYVEKYAKQYVKQMQLPAMVCFNDVHELTMKVYKVLIDRCFGSYPRFADKAKEAIKQRQMETQSRGKEQIAQYFVMEDNFIFTQDSTYIEVLYEEEMEEEDEMLNVRRQGRSSRGNKMAPHDATMHDVEKILKSLTSYYKVAMRRICDHIPMLVQQHIFKEEVKAINIKLNAMAVDDEMLNLIVEQEDVASKREIYTKKQLRLQKAMAELDKFGLAEPSFDFTEGSDLFSD